MVHRRYFFRLNLQFDFSFDAPYPLEPLPSWKPVFGVRGAQLIERIGPVRQMQAGYDRLVHVYRLRAIHTFDDVVIDRLTTKASVESAVRGAMIQ